jgi:hypothetical protein
LLEDAMVRFASWILLFASGVLCWSQTAEELVNKNLGAKGGVEKIKAIHTLRVRGTLQQGGFKAQTASEAKAPDLLRETFTIQGMTQIMAYDGSAAWQISPFEGRKDPELLGEDESRDLIEQADFYGPLVDYAEKGNHIEYLGHDTVDGDDALRLKVTLKNGDIYYYLLDPDTFLEIRLEKQQFIRGAVHESVTDLGAYKQVAGVYFPFSVETGPKRNPNARTKVMYDAMEANVAINDADFKMPAPPATPSPQTHPEPPIEQQKKQPPKAPMPAKPPQQP